MEKKKKKICLISSSGGHFEQLLMLKQLEKYYDDIILVTERTKYNKKNKKINYYVSQINRKEILFIPKMLIIGIKSLYILLKENPDVVISTGVLATIPMLVMAHILKKKVIYIESFAKINSPTMTGNLIYKKNIANQFYVQWESMLEFYPDAIYKGGIY